MISDNSDSFISDDEEDYCPLCVEEMDITDKNFKPCPCGYQICQFCYNNIRTNPELNGRCPACRRKYEDANIVYTTMSAEEIRAQQLKAERKKKEKLKQEKEKKDAEQAKRHHLAGMRVIQKNLVYVVGLNPHCGADELPTLLRSDKYFGQYGKILKIVINRKNPPPQTSSSNSTSPYSVYVTFARKEDASRCIRAVDGSISDGKVLRAAHGTTKYCSSYLRGQPCQNPNCMFLHEPGEEADSYTRQDLSTRSINNKLLERSATNGLIPPPSSSSGGSYSSDDHHIPHQHSHHGSSYVNSGNNVGKSPSTSPQSLASQLHHEASLPATAAWAKSSNSTPQPVTQTSSETLSSAFPTLGDALSSAQKAANNRQAQQKRKEKQKDKDKDQNGV
ncbi:unnamed protein product [Ambrosiozyma monospora]|uniref:Unnamed protein product n=1 Tax=Ambrosiozyma monospora TaxID=43982 RepID=A0ACB5T4C8_AMBMO|nr:unnamed protein product [Ambrosiozyma monospora]